MEIPLSFSMSIQSDFANCPDPRPFTVPAFVMALPNSRTFSVMVVLPASGCDIIAKVRRFAISCSKLSILE